MPIDITALLQRGYERTVARTGLIFAGIFYVVSVLNALFTPELPRQPFTPERMPEWVPEGIRSPEFVSAGSQPYAPSLGLSPAVAGLLSLGLAIVSLVITVAAIRTFVGGETEKIPPEYARRNIVWVGLNLVVGSIVFAIALAIGFVLFVIPGLFLLVSLIFWEVHVVVEDENFVDGFRNSWELTSGHRLRLFALGVVVAFVSVVVSALFGIPAPLVPDVLGFLIAQIGSALLSVFSLATIAETYNRLLAMEADRTEGPDGSPDEFVHER